MSIDFMESKPNGGFVTAEHRRSFEEEGYVVLEGFFRLSESLT